MNGLLLGTNILKMSIISIVMLSFVLPVRADVIFFSCIEKDAFKNNFTTFERNDCFNAEGPIFIDMKKPLLLIKNNQINNMKFADTSQLCVNTPYIDLVIEVKKEFYNNLKEFSVANIKNKVAVFFDGDLINAASIYGTLEEGFTVASCLTYEKAAILMLNNGFNPNYEKTCIANQIDTTDLERKYDFKDDFSGRKDHHPSLLEYSEFWCLKDNTQVYKSPNGEIIATIRAMKIIEQYFNLKTKTFERDKDWIRIVYEEKLGWIKKDRAIPFFALLDTNLFLQKFFIFNEYRYQRQEKYKSAFPNYMIERLNSIRKSYIKEALSRFKNAKEFQKWYLDTFGRKCYF